MNEAELRELDDWIAVKFMGWKRLSPAPGSGRAHPLSWESPNGLVTWETTSYGEAFRPTSRPFAFSQVKREIERRGWSWSGWHDVIHGLPLYFDVILPKPPMEVDVFRQTADTEELAGCLAIKEAVESGSAL